MKWKAFINDPNGDASKARVEKFELTNTKPCDAAFAMQHAANLYKVDSWLILCVPDRDEV